VPVVGSYARVEVGEYDLVHARLAALPGVTTFDLGSRDRVGLLVEAKDLDDAHDTVSRVIPAVEGVLGVFPVSIHMDYENDDQSVS